MTERRSRMRRTKTGKPLALSQRDLLIFVALSQYRYLRSTYLHAFAGGASEKRFIERLGDLFHEGYIDRPAVQWDYANARTAPVVYEIGVGGQRSLEGLGGEGNEARTFLGSHTHRQFAHSLMICACLASIELATRARADLRFIPWPEILAKAPEATRRSSVPFRLETTTGAVVPDGIFGLEYQIDGRNAYRFFALEADRGTMPVARSKANQTSLLGKLNVYRDIIATQAYRTRWGVPNLLVLTVTVSQPHLTAVTEQLTDRPPFLFRFVGSLTKPDGGLLNEPWQRVKRPPLSVGSVS